MLKYIKGSPQGIMAQNSCWEHIFSHWTLFVQWGKLSPREEFKIINFLLVFFAVFLLLHRPVQKQPSPKIYNCILYNNIPQTQELSVSCCPESLIFHPLRLRLHQSGGGREGESGHCSSCTVVPVTVGKEHTKRRERGAWPLESSTTKLHAPRDSAPRLHGMQCTLLTCSKYISMTDLKHK